MKLSNTTLFCLIFRGAASQCLSAGLVFQVAYLDNIHYASSMTLCHTGC